MYYLGIDPGQNGGIVLLDERGRVARAEKMPATEADIWNAIPDGMEHDVTAMLEKVHSMPGQGVASTFKFGMGYGGLRMALIASSVPFDDVTPQKWQKALGIVPRKPSESKTAFKNRLKSRSQILFPREKVTLSVCDALLIAHYCYCLCSERVSNTRTTARRKLTA